MIYFLSTLMLLWNLPTTWRPDENTTVTAKWAYGWNYDQERDKSWEGYYVHIQTVRTRQPAPEWIRKEIEENAKIGIYPSQRYDPLGYTYTDNEAIPLPN